MGAETEWPSPNVQHRAYHLTTDGLSETPGEGERTVSTDFTVGAKAAYFCAGMRIDNELSDDQAEDDALSVCFDTAPLDAPLELLGRPEIEIGVLGG